jgi:hypothetical protein
MTHKGALTRRPGGTRALRSLYDTCTRVITLKVQTNTIKNNFYKKSTVSNG